MSLPNSQTPSEVPTGELIKTKVVIDIHVKNLYLKVEKPC